MKRIALATLTAVTLAGCNTMNDTSTSADMSAMMATMPVAAMPYLEMAAASDLYEKESSQLALSRSQNADIRGYAQMMITDHTKTTQTLMNAARGAGMTPPAAQLSAMQQDMMTQLRGANGAAFDRLYLDQQTMAHEKAVALHTRFAKDGNNASLRSAASAAVPIVRTHLDRVRRMNAMM